MLSYIEFGVLDPRTGEPLQVVNQLSGTSLTAFLSAMVTTLSSYYPEAIDPKTDEDPELSWYAAELQINRTVCLIRNPFVMKSSASHCSNSG